MPYRKRRKTKARRKGPDPYSMGRRPATRILNYFRYKNPTHYFKRVVNFANITPLSVSGGLTKQGDGIFLASTTTVGAGVTYGGASLYITVGDMPDYTAFQGMFDRYRIRGVGVKIIPYTTQSLAQETGGSNPSSSVIIHSVIDYDDSNTPAASDAGVNQLREFESYKVQNMNTGKGFFKRYFKPRQALATYAGAFTSYANSKAMWNDWNSPSVQHYGLKFIMETFNPNVAATTYAWFKAEYTIYFANKDLK